VAPIVEEREEAVSMCKLLVVGVDGSPEARSALDWALRRGSALEATVRVVTAYSWPGPSWHHPNSPPEERARAHRVQQREIEAVLAEIDDPPPIQDWVVEGAPGNVLIEAARDADLLVVGSRGLGRVARTLLGSVAEECIRRGHIPVLVMPAAGLGTPVAA
jgi:nucleotide-binding universal stress UspA family protein